MNKRKIKQKRIEGDFLGLDLGEGWYAFARVLPNPLMGFYDYRSRNPLEDLSFLDRKAFIFKVWVMAYAVKNGVWPVIGNMPLEPMLLAPPLFFKQDPISGILSTTYIGGGDEKPATLEDCKKLECAAVWDPEHIIDRLNDHFAGRPSKLVERMRPKT